MFDVDLYVDTIEGKKCVVVPDTEAFGGVYELVYGQDGFFGP